MTRTIPFLALLLAACGKPSDHPTCTADEACAVGRVCERPAAGEDGVCTAAYALAVTEPAAGSWIQRSAEVTASVELLAATRSLPATVELMADGLPAGTLAREGTSGSYRGSWTPAAGTVAAVGLRVAVGRGTRGEQRSEARLVNVDRVQPAIASVSTGCTPDCKRDGTLQLEVRVAEPNPATVTAALDLDPSRVVALSRQGSTDLYEAQVPLPEYAFPHFERNVQVAVRVLDQAGNEATAAAVTKVTRLRWVYAAGAPVTSPAVMSDGTLVLGVSATSEQLRAVGPDGTEAWRLTVGTAFITAAPSVGSTAIWVGSEDGRVYAVAPDGSAVLNGAGCSTGGALKGAVSLSVSGPQIGFGASAGGRTFAVNTGTLCAAAPLTDAFTAPPAVDRSGRILAATATATATATLRQYVFDGGAFTPGWSAQVGVNVSAPMAVDAADRVWSGSQDARLNATPPSGVTSTVRTLGGSIVDSPVVLTGGDIVVGDQARVLHRFAPDGTQVWATEPLLDGPVLAPLVLAGSDATLLVPTKAGSVFAIGADGAVIWSGSLTPGQELRSGNIHTPTGSASSTACFGSSNGNLYAVVVDGGLDASAPWPKAHHDIRNTGNAGSPLP